MAENVCKKCIHWNREKKKFYGECWCDKFVHLGDEVFIEKDGLGYWDYSDYMAGFNVGEDFGCIHFERKDKNGE